MKTVGGIRLEQNEDESLDDFWFRSAQLGVAGFQVKVESLGRPLITEITYRELPSGQGEILFEFKDPKVFKWPDVIARGFLTSFVSVPLYFLLHIGEDVKKLIWFIVVSVLAAAGWTVYKNRHELEQGR